MFHNCRFQSNCLIHTKRTEKNTRLDLMSAITQSCSKYRQKDAATQVRAAKDQAGVNTASRREMGIKERETGRIEMENSDLGLCRAASDTAHWCETNLRRKPRQQGSPRSIQAGVAAAKFLMKREGKWWSVLTPNVTHMLDLVSHHSGFFLLRGSTAISAA